MLFLRRIILCQILALITCVVTVSEALAQAAAPGTAQPASLSGMLVELLPMFAIVFLIFYFMIIRPQQQKLIEHKKLVESLKKGELVATSGGILGRVAAVEKDHVQLEVCSNVKIRVETAHVTRRAEKASAEAQSA